MKFLLVISLVACLIQFPLYVKASMEDYIYLENVLLNRYHIEIPGISKDHTMNANVFAQFMEVCLKEDVKPIIPIIYQKDAKFQGHFKSLVRACINSGTSGLEKFGDFIKLCFSIDEMKKFDVKTSFYATAQLNRFATEKYFDKLHEKVYEGTSLGKEIEIFRKIFIPENPDLIDLMDSLHSNLELVDIPASYLRSVLINLSVTFQEIFPAFIAKVTDNDILVSAYKLVLNYYKSFPTEPTFPTESSFLRHFKFQIPNDSPLLNKSLLEALNNYSSTDVLSSQCGFLLGLLKRPTGFDHVKRLHSENFKSYPLDNLSTNVEVRRMMSILFLIRNYSNYKYPLKVGIQTLIEALVSGTFDNVPHNVWPNFTQDITKDVESNRTLVLLFKDVFKKALEDLEFKDRVSFVSSIYPILFDGTERYAHTGELLNYIGRQVGWKSGLIDILNKLSLEDESDLLTNGLNVLIASMEEHRNYDIMASPLIVDNEFAIPLCNHKQFDDINTPLKSWIGCTILFLENNVQLIPSAILIFILSVIALSRLPKADQELFEEMAIQYVPSIVQKSQTDSTEELEEIGKESQLEELSNANIFSIVPILLASSILIL